MDRQAITGRLSPLRYVHSLRPPQSGLYKLSLCPPTCHLFKTYVLYHHLVTEWFLERVSSMSPREVLLIMDPTFRIPLFFVHFVSPCHSTCLSSTTSNAIQEPLPFPSSPICRLLISKPGSATLRHPLDEKIATGKVSCRFRMDTSTMFSKHGTVVLSMTVAQHLKLSPPYLH